MSSSRLRLAAAALLALSTLLAGPAAAIDVDGPDDCVRFLDDWGDAPSHWATYIAVDSADDTVAKITENGGSVRVPPFDAPGVGRMAMVADPSGADFAIIQFVQA